MVMPGLVPGIHVFGLRAFQEWMAGTSPAMTGGISSSRIAAVFMNSM
jgi:hypothetical protein